MVRHTFFAGLVGLALLSACVDKADKGAEEKTDSTASVKTEAPMSKSQIAEAYIVAGDTVSPDEAVTPDAVEAALAKEDGADFTVRSQVESVCEVKGCWMKVKLPSGKLMHITFKDYGFFVPKDLAGKEVIFQGHAYNDTISVEEAQHFAEDKGKSEAEIAAITKPEVTILFNANGVLIPKAAEGKKM